MFNKIIAAIVMGVVVAILSLVVGGVALGGGERGGSAALWAGLGGLLVTFVLALTATRGRYAWGRGMVVCAILCFAMPLAALLFTAGFAASHMPTVPNDAAAKAGATIGLGLAGTAMTLVSVVIGFFLGLIFVVFAILLLRAPRTEQPSR